MIDKHGPTWLAFREWAQATIESSRELLERQDLPERTSDYERGYIAALRDALELPEQEKS